MDFLQFTLLGNAFFSLVTGLSLIFFHKSICKWFGRQRSTPFWTIGVGLTGFASFLFLLAQKPEWNWVWLIIVLDGIWVLGSVTILIFKPFGLSTKGHGIIGGIALIVLLFALGQFLGMR